MKKTLTGVLCPPVLNQDAKSLAGWMYGADDQSDPVPWENLLPTGSPHQKR